MSGFYDDASWVLIPEGIKEDVVYAQKPTDGLGDLTFTRASDATRTNSAGVIERTPWNLLQFSEQFDNAAWTKSLGTLSANVIAAPNGTLTADLFQKTSAVNTVSQVSSSSSTYQTTGVHTLSIYIRPNVGNIVQLRLDNATNTANFTFNFTTKTFTQSGANAISSSFSEVGDGWFRLVVTGNVTSTGWSITPCLLFANPTGDSMYIWGAQLVEGTDAKPYFATTNRQDVPRLDYRNADGSVSTCPRLLLEPQRTNSIRNSTMVGAVAGSPGTLPTNWVSSNGGLTQTIVGVGTENGLQYIDLRFNGTSNATIVQVRFDAANQIAASNGQTWSYTIYAKAISQPAPPISYTQLIFERTAAGTLIKSGSQVMTLTSNLQRFSYTRTLDGGVTVGAVDPVLYLNIANGATYDFTIRIAAPQMELGAYATTFIPTTTAAVTRLADTALKTGVADLIGQTEGTLFLEFVAQLTGANQSFSISNGTTSQRVDIRITANAFQTVGTFNGSSELNITGGTAVNGATYKMAVAYKTNDAALYVNGVQIGTDSLLGVVGTFNRIGFDVAAGTQPFNSPVVQAALFPTRLTNAQLAQITTL